MVKLSYSVSYLNDYANLDDWGEVQDGTTGTGVVDNASYLKQNVTVCGGNEIYYWVNATNMQLNPATNAKKIRWRFKTSADPIRAKIVLEDSGGHFHTVLEDSSSTSFTVGEAEIDFGDADLLDHIRLHADHSTGDVWWDFIQVFTGDFQIPHTLGGMDLELPSRDAVLGIPGKGADIIQRLGTQSAVVTLPSLDLTRGTWKRSGDALDAEVFLEMWHNSFNQPWQWLNTEVGHQFKVTVEPRFHWGKSGEAVTRIVDLVLREYSLEDKNEETYLERFGIGL